MSEIAGVMAKLDALDALVAKWRRNSEERDYAAANAILECCDELAALLATLKST